MKLLLIILLALVLLLGAMLFLVYRKIMQIEKITHKRFAIQRGINEYLIRESLSRGKERAELVSTNKHLLN